MSKSLLGIAQNADGSDIMKRRADAATKGWDDKTDDNTHKKMLTDTVERAKSNDTIRGEWYVNIKQFNGWVDASSLAAEVPLEVNGSTIEDAG